MATSSHGTNNTDDDPTSELPALSDSVAAKRAMDPDAIPVLTDVTESLPVLTDVLHPGPESEQELHRRVEAQESRLREAIDQLDRVKEQAAWVRDALLNEQRDRSRLEEQVSALLEQRTDDRPQIEEAREPDEPAPAQQAAMDLALASQIAALTDYIACRKQWWHDMEQLAEANRLRITELELEVAQRTRREAEAQTVAERESGRARELQQALIGATREIEQLRRTLSAQRASNGRIPPEYGTHE